MHACVPRVNKHEVLEEYNYSNHSSSNDSNCLLLQVCSAGLGDHLPEIQLAVTSSLGDNPVLH